MAVASIAIAVGLVRRRRAGLPIIPAADVAVGGWSFLTVLLVAATAIGCQFAGIMAAHASAPPAARTADLAITTPELFGAAAGTLVAAAVGVAIVLGSGGTRRSLGLFSDDPSLDLRLAIGTVLLITPPLLLLAGALNSLVPYEHPILELLARSRDPATLAAVWLSAVVAAPIGEELFFRGILQGWFESVASRSDATRESWMPVAASSLAFAAAHAGHGLGWIPLAGFGLAVGLLRAARGSLLSCIAVHAIFNAISVTLILVR
jgi:membrane protease YdiL (CAAX protease family)